MSIAIASTQPQDLSLPAQASSRNRYDRLWQTIEEGIEENVFIIVGKNSTILDSPTDTLALATASTKDPIEEAGKKIRALESAARVLARSAKARAEFPSDAADAMDPETSDDLEPVQQFPRERVVPEKAEASKNDEICLAQLQDSNAILPEETPKTSLVPAYSNKFRAELQNPDTELENSSPSSHLAGILLPQDPLLENHPEEARLLHENARRFLGPTFSSLLQNAEKSRRAKKGHKRLC